jgi:hypothetical protein
MLLKSSSFSIRSPVVLGEDSFATSNSTEYSDSRVPRISFFPYHDKHSECLGAGTFRKVDSAKGRFGY